MPFQCSWIAAAFGCLVISLSGCTGSNNPVAKAGGVVTLDNKPVPDLVVTFTPIPGETQFQGEAGMTGKTASGRTDSNGKFTLSTYEIGDGALIGKHKVTVALDGTVTTPPGNVPKDYTLEVKPGGNNFDIQLKK